MMLINCDVVFSLPHGSGHLGQVYFRVLLPQSRQGTFYLYATLAQHPLFVVIIPCLFVLTAFTLLPLHNSAAVLSIVSLLHDAKVHCEKYQSHAVDAGTDERSTIQLLTRMLNNLSASSEYSGTQACATALGLPANFCMHNK